MRRSTWAHSGAHVGHQGPQARAQLWADAVCFVRHHHQCLIQLAASLGRASESNDPAIQKALDFESAWDWYRGTDDSDPNMLHEAGECLSEAVIDLRAQTEENFRRSLQYLIDAGRTPFASVDEMITNLDIPPPFGEGEEPDERPSDPLDDSDDD